MGARTSRSQPESSRPHMPGYGINEDRKGMLPWRWAERLLTTTQNYLLATVRVDGRPHVMPVWGVWLDNRFVFSTGRKSVKARNLAHNANCVVCGEEGDAVVILEGKAVKIRDKEVLKKFNAAYLRKYKFDPSSMNEPVFSVRPRVVFGQIEKTFVSTATRWKF